jgi:hypothetical protein
MGLMIGVFAMWCFNWRRDRLAVFDAEMKIVSLELVKFLESQHHMGKF